MHMLNIINIFYIDVTQLRVGSNAQASPATLKTPIRVMSEAFLKKVVKQLSKFL